MASGLGTDGRRTAPTLPLWDKLYGRAKKRVS